jgi:hypothetical protein
MEIQRYDPWTRDELGHDMQAGIKEDADGQVVLYADHLTAIKELQDMIAFLIAFVPDMTERQRYLDWLAERRKS